MHEGSAWTAVFWGALSAASLPLGSVLGLWLRPSNKWTSSLMSFGAGALLAALTLELVAPSLHKVGFLPIGVGCVSGALLFMLLNALLNTQGGFLRKLSTTMGHLTRRKRQRAEDLLEKCSHVALLRALPPEEMQAVVPLLHEAGFEAGETIFRRGSKGERLYLIEEGEAEVRRGVGKGGPEIAMLAAGDSFGEMALLSGQARIATVSAKTDLSTWVLEKDDFDHLLGSSPGLKKAVTELSHKRKAELEKLIQAASEDEEESRTWAAEAKANLDQAAVALNQEDIKEAAKKHGGGAAFAIWLGILLDGIPESLVIGASMIATGSVSMTLIVGVFLANFPEALSSSVGMRNQGYTFMKVLWMWSSLMILTAIGAGVGYLTFGNLPPAIFVLVEGLAAGAMLAMIAETMLPEAHEQGGPANGLLTVLGFLAAIFVSTLGGPAAH